MFTKLYQTAYRPSKPLLIWDGECGFCRYWIIKMKKKTNDRVNYKPYQELLDRIPDIPKWAFREAARLVDTDGKIYNGPEAGYKALSICGIWSFLFKNYKHSTLFRYASNRGYTFIARHRKFFYFLTKILFSKVQ